MTQPMAVLCCEADTTYPDGFAVCVNYAALAETSIKDAVLWLDLTSRAPLLGPEGIQAIVRHVRDGGGLVVTGSPGVCSLTESVIGDLLPISATGDRDLFPSWSVADVAEDSLSYWPGAGRVKVESEGHPALTELGWLDGAIAPAGVACELKDGANLVARFLTTPAMGAEERRVPYPWPFLAEWAIGGGRVVYVALPADRLSHACDGFDGPSLVGALTTYAALTPSAMQRAECLAAHLEGRLARCRERMGALGLGVVGRLEEALLPPERALSDAHRAIDGKAGEAALKALGNAQRLIDAVHVQVADAEADQLRAAVTAHDFFHFRLGELEASGLVREWEVERMASAGLAAKSALSAGHCTDALKRYRGLCEALTHRLSE